MVFQPEQFYPKDPTSRDNIKLIPKLNLISQNQNQNKMERKKFLNYSAYNCSRVTSDQLKKTGQIFEIQNYVPTKRKLIDDDNDLKNTKKLQLNTYYDQSNVNDEPEITKSNPKSLPLLTRNSILENDDTEEMLPVCYDSDDHRPHGLDNLGNTCYLNSVLQTLFSFEFFINEIQKFYAEQSETPDDDDDSENSSSMSIIKHLLILNKVYRDNISTFQVSNCLNSLKQCIGNHVRNFQSNEQQDAAEFFTIFLDLIKKEINKKNSNTTMFARNPVEKYFEHKLTLKAQCPNCDKIYDQTIPNHNSNTFHLQLGVNQNIQSAFINYLKKETLHSKCQDCDENFLIYKNFIELPKILFLQFARYSDDGFKVNKELSVSHIIYLPKEFIKPEGMLSPLATPYKSSLIKAYNSINNNSQASIVKRLDFNSNNNNNNDKEDDDDIFSDIIVNIDEQRKNMINSNSKENQSIFENNDNIDHCSNNNEMEEIVQIKNDEIIDETQCEKYQLVSIICHYGLSLNCGHYVSYVFDFENQKWFFCNDNEVKEVDFNSVENESKTTGYCYFYAHVQ